jgi:RNA 2',3'-cyclic 3'-phosphodiesterase
MTDTKRLFVGVRVSIATANALAGAAETLARRARDAKVDLRWVAPVGYHVTLKFLGATREAAISAVRDVLEQATEATHRISFRTTRLGGFPSLDKARVLWAGVEEPSGALAALAARIEAGCTKLGFAAEGDRRFHAHVTLGRARETRPLREVVLPLAEQMFGDTRIDAITLFESETKSSGSVYRELHRIAFKTAEKSSPEGSERQTSALQLDARNESRSDGKESDSDLDTDDGWPRGHVPNT